MPSATTTTLLWTPPAATTPVVITTTPDVSAVSTTSPASTTTTTVAVTATCIEDTMVKVRTTTQKVEYQESAVLVQRKLVELGYDVGEVDGYVGPKTLDALEAWAKKEKLQQAGWNPKRGVIEQDVLDRLGVRCEEPEQQADPEPSDEPVCELTIDPAKPPVYSDLSLQVQRRLTKAGFRLGKPDGVFGPRSQAALQAWVNKGDKRVVNAGGQTYTITPKGFADLGFECTP